MLSQSRGEVGAVRSLGTGRAGMKVARPPGMELPKTSPFPLGDTQGPCCLCASTVLLAHLPTEGAAALLFPPAAMGRLPPLPALHAPNGISLSRLLSPRLRTRSFNLFYWQRKEIIGVEIRRLSVFLKIRPQLSGWKGGCVSEEGSWERCRRVTQLPSPCASSPWKPVGFSFSLHPFEDTKS